MGGFLFLDRECKAEELLYGLCFDSPSRHAATALPPRSLTLSRSITSCPQLGLQMNAYCPVCTCSCRPPDGCRVGTLGLAGGEGSGQAEAPLGLPRRPLQVPTGQQAWLGLATEPAVASKHRGRFTNLRDSVKKSPTKSTAKVKAAGGRSTGGSEPGGAAVEVRLLLGGGLSP